MGCYGNTQARTPRIDALAKEGVLFEHAYSNAPVCAVARATILNGAWSPTMGTQHMRSRTIAVETLWNLGKKEQAKAVLINEVDKDPDASSFLYLLNTLRRLELLDELPDGWQRTKARKQGTAETINRFTKGAGIPQEE